MAQVWWKTNQENEEFTDWQELRTDDGLIYYFNRTTQETTWDKPEELMSDDEKQSAMNWVWVPDENDVYVPGRKVNQNGNQWVVELESGEERHANSNQCIPLKKSSLQRIVEDLTLLDEMSVPLILYCLRKRFEGGKIYSAVGTILISINPYTQLDLYTPAMIKKYKNSLEEHREVPPHVFVIADQAYKGLTFETGPNQSIVISGESGAGKTEAAKQCLSYLGAVAGSIAGVEKKVFDANPILESFGNAKTVRNNNSSRFGKYVEIYLNEHLQLMGGKTRNYLLEKVRVGRQGEGERNYHIFYMLTKGAERNLRQELELKQPEEYHYCAQGGNTTVPGINDKSDFDELNQAFKTLEFSDKDVHSIWRLLAGILHIGNIEFQVVKDNYKDDTSKVTNLGPLQIASKLWGVDGKALEKGVTHKALIMPGQKTVDVGLKPEDARDQRDSLCKFVYDKLFDWLVEQINKAMETNKKVHKSIGILDIFGFEIFQQNSLEQLCINFCNEKLQQLFNFTVFKQEEKVYQSEQIGVEHVPFIDNQPILDMIEQKPKGIMPLLDEEGRTPGGSESKYRAKLTNEHGKNKSFKAYAKDQECFVLSHYAGDVVYDTRGFMEKNKDILDKGLLILLDQAKESIIRTLFPKGQSEMSSADRKMTLSAQFRTQLEKLMGSLQQTQPHYIRCVKPNEDKEPLYFVPRSCFEQLTYSGVFEAVKIRKSGFPFRLKHQEFVERYKCILEEAHKPIGQGVKGCQDICKFVNLNPDNIRQGKTMMLYRAQEHRDLELKRNIIMEKRKMNETLQELVNTDPNTLDEPELHYERLARAVRSCKRYNINTPLAEQARKLLQVYIESRIDPSTKALLEEAITYKDINKLEEVCEIIEREQYETDRCKLALRLRDRIRRIIQESEKAVVTLDTNHMEACLYAAQELEYTNDYIEYFRWMFDTLGKDSEKFVQEQMRQAVKMNDIKRQIRISIKLKTLFFSKMGQMFAIQNCPILKDVEDWAGEKLLPFGKDKLKLGYMTHSVEEIHSQVTTIDKKLKGRAKEIFKLVQIYMMDRPPADNQTPDQAGVEVLKAGQGEPELRNEIYCQLIKQLTNNPNMQSVNRGWDLLIVALYIFPPTAELENYLEVFIRNSPQDKQDRTLVALHSIVYSANAGQRNPPSLQDLKDILTGLRPLRKDFMEEPPTVPSWADLLKPFSETDEEEEQYFNSAQPQLAGAVGPQPKLANNKPMSMVRRHHLSVASPAAAPTGPPKFKFNNAEEKNDDKPQNSPVKLPPVPTEAIQQQPQQQQPPKFQPPTQPTQNQPKPNQNNGAISELQAKLAAKGGPFGQQPSQQPKTNNNPPSQAEKNPPMPGLYDKQKQEKAQPASGNVNAKASQLASALNKGPSGANNKQAQAPQQQNQKSSAQNVPPKGPPQYKWLCHLDPETGDVFYENIASGATQWERPKEPVKPHWIAHLDPDSGELYFENIDSGETSWDRPEEFSDPDEKFVAHKDAQTSNYYYENVETGQTTWDAPPCFQEKVPQQEWLRHFDPNSGEYYYENVRTGLTTWDAPQGINFN